MSHFKSRRNLVIIIVCLGMILSNAQDNTRINERYQNDFSLDTLGETVEIYAISYSHSDITSETWQRDNEDKVDECVIDELLLTTKFPGLDGRHSLFSDNKDEELLIGDKNENIAKADEFVVDECLNANTPQLLEKTSDHNKISAIEFTVSTLPSEQMEGVTWVPSVENGKLSTEFPTITDKFAEGSPYRDRNKQTIIKAKEIIQVTNRSLSAPRGGRSGVPKIAQFRDQAIVDPHGEKSKNGATNDRRCQSVTRGLLLHPEVIVTAHERLYSKAVQKQSESRTKINASVNNRIETTMKPINRNKNGPPVSPRGHANRDLSDYSSKILSEAAMKPHDRLYNMALKKQQEARHKIEAHTGQIECSKAAICDQDKFMSKKVRPVSPMKTTLKDTGEHEKVPNYGKFCYLYDRGMRQIQRLEEMRRLAAEQSSSPLKTRTMDLFHRESDLKIPSPVSRTVKKNEYVTFSSLEDREEIADSVRTTEASRE